MRAMIDTYFADAQIDSYINVFAEIRIEQKPIHERKKKEARKPEFSPNWIAENILKPGSLPGLNSEARDIVIICAETGCRESEVFDLPAASIVIDAPIPHIRIRVEDGPVGQRRDVKTAASIRDVPLVGAALEAMKRNPTGFPRYRGNANYYNTTRKYLLDNGLFPSDAHSLGGLRHSYESRMRRAGVDNEERGFMMGHSLKKIRGREVYGDETSLKLRALFAEMVSLPTDTWKPRPHAELRAEIAKLLVEEGFRVA
jgi:integrase